VSGELLLACSPGEVWAALVEDGALEGLRVLRAGGGRVGEILFGRVLALRPELPAALIDIGTERPGFLSAEDALPGAGIAGLHEGQGVVVQVTKEARGGKATGLTLRPRLVGRLVVLTPLRPGIGAERGLAPEEARRLEGALGAGARAEEGFTLRKAAAGADASALAEEAAALRQRWQRIEAARRRGKPPCALEAAATPVGLALAAFAPERPDSVVVDDRAGFAEARRWLAQHRPALLAQLSFHGEAAPLFEARGIAEDVASLLAARLTLASGGALTIEETAAATMIDVDLGSARPKGGAARGALAVNLEAAEEVARQIRLRGLAGPIVVDFIGMRGRLERDRMRAALAAALGDDAEILGWTRLGHLELVRTRREAPLASLLFERTPEGGRMKTALTVALEALRALARAAAATPPRAAVLTLHPEVAAMLDGAAHAARRELEQRLGRMIELRAEPGRARDAFDIRLD
jgi:ribonuclease G